MLLLVPGATLWGSEVRIHTYPRRPPNPRPKPAKSHGQSHRCTWWKGVGAEWCCSLHWDLRGFRPPCEHLRRFIVCTAECMCAHTYVCGGREGARRNSS